MVFCQHIGYIDDCRLSSFRSSDMPERKSVEQQIREAMAAGEFDNLPGKGKPLDLDSYFKTPDHLRLAYHILKDSGFVPPELKIKKDIDKLKALRDAADDSSERKRLDREIAKTTAVYHMALERNRSAE